MAVGPMVTPLAAATVNGPIRVSADGRHFSGRDGRPFFWLGDTAWPLFAQYTKAQAEAYLANRGGKGFTVIQGVLAWGLGSGMENKTPLANANGDKPWLDDEPARRMTPTSATWMPSSTSPTSTASSSRCSRPGATT